MSDGPTDRPRIARIWRGRTKRERADEYEAYNSKVLCCYMGDELDHDLRTTMNQPSSARLFQQKYSRPPSCPPWLSKGNLAYRHIAGLRRMSPRVVSGDIRRCRRRNNTRPCNR